MIVKKRKIKIVGLNTDSYNLPKKQQSITQKYKKYKMTFSHLHIWLGLTLLQVS